MNSILKYSVMAALIASLSACETLPDEMEGANFLNVGKFGTLDPTCFYGTNPPVPDADGGTNKMNLEKQVVAFKYLPNGRLIRLKPNRTLQTKLAEPISVTDWVDELKLAGSNDFIPYLQTGAGANSPVTSVGTSLNRDPDPLDLELHWYTKLAFVLVPNGNSQNGHPTGAITFETEFPEFIVVRGNYTSPFFNLTREDDDLITVDYVSLPPTSSVNYDKIYNRDCVYEYVLNTVNTFTSNPGGVQMQTRLTIDPGGEGEGDDPPPPQPPTWP